MNTAAIKRLLTILSSKVGIERARLYQLVDLAERCYSLKDVKGQRELGLLLQTFPPPFDVVGSYYEGVSLSQTSLFDEARKRLERVYEHGPAKYRAKALLSLSAVEERSGNLDEAMRLRLRASCLDVPAVVVESQLGRAAILGMQDDHEHAVKCLERFLPLAKMAARNTPLYYDYLNSFAVELNDSGRTEEASNVIKLVLSTPYVRHYPNWIDTGEEVYRKSYRSSMVSAPKVIFDKPEPEPKSETDTQAASVLSFPTLKEAPRPQKPDRLTPQQYARLSVYDKRELIMAAIKSGAVDESDYYKMMVMTGLITTGPADKILDLEDEGVLDDIAVEWSVQVGKEALAGFLSALRDCQDSLRLTNILDRLITKIFYESQECGISEDEWRQRVERRLPEK
jgi:tetratricopeptide (TPR) repeat protein